MTPHASPAAVAGAAVTGAAVTRTAAGGPIQEPGSAPWCRACGCEVTGADSTCGGCGWPLSAPDPGPARVGRVVVIPTKLLTRHGVAVAETADTVSVLVKGDTPEPMGVGQFDALAAVPVPGPPVIGAAGRLWAANLAMRARSVKGKWSAETVDATATRLAELGLDQLRAATVDALALGLAGFPEQAALTASELSWYRARQAGLAGETAELLRWLEALPASGYTERVRLLLRYAAGLLDDPGLAGRARAVLEPFVSGSADARALWTALAAPPASPAGADPAPAGPAAADPAPADPAVRDLADLVSFAELVARAGDASYASLPGIATALAGGERPAVLPPPPVPQLTALDAYLAARAGQDCDRLPHKLVPVPPVLLDDLVEAGALPPVTADGPPWTAALNAYLRCRQDPGGVDLDTVRAAGHTAELARRYYLADDRAGLAGLPAEDEAVRHYRALREVRATGLLDDLTPLRPAVRELLARVARLAGPAPDGGHEVPEEVAADPTVWPLLQDAARRGQLVAPAALRDRFPGVGHWLDLCEAQRLLFDQRWEEAVAAGRRIAGATGVERVRDEAQNLVAFGLWQSGRTGEALELLREALAGRFTNGLVVNAALVASEQGCLAALPYLEQAMRLATDHRVRQGALSRAVTLWLADPDVPDFPQPLAAMVRTALTADQPDDEYHRMLLMVSAAHDSQWLAGASPRHRDPGQKSAVDYFRIRARVLSDKHRETLDDLARLLVAAHRGGSPPPWLERERNWLSGLLLDLVHTTFGEAPGLVAPIETLSGGGLLDLPAQIVLHAQAGAHVAAYLGNQGECLAPEAERRLIFEAVRIFRSRGGELAEPVRNGVAEELARCICVAGMMINDATGRFLRGEFGPRWDALVQRERWDYQNRYQIIRFERELLDELDQYLGRCRAYLGALAGLPLAEPQRQMRDQLASNLDDWSREAARLRSLL